MQGGLVTDFTLVRVPYWHASSFMFTLQQTIQRMNICYITDNRQLYLIIAEYNWLSASSKIHLLLVYKL